MAASLISYDDVPNELVMTIASKLPAKDLASFTLVNKQNMDIVKSEYFWTLRKEKSFFDFINSVWKDLDQSDAYTLIRSAFGFDEIIPRVKTVLMNGESISDNFKDAILNLDEELALVLWKIFNVSENLSSRIPHMLNRFKIPHERPDPIYHVKEYSDMETWHGDVANFFDRMIEEDMLEEMKLFIKVAKTTKFKFDVGSDLWIDDEAFWIMIPCQILEKHQYDMIRVLIDEVYPNGWFVMIAMGLYSEYLEEINFRMKAGDFPELIEAMKMIPFEEVNWHQIGSRSYDFISDENYEKEIFQGAVRTVMEFYGKTKDEMITVLGFKDDEML